MKKVIFCREGEAVSDFEIEKKVSEFVASSREEWKISNDIVLTFFRVLIKEQKIDKRDYTFEVEDLAGRLNHFYVNKDGRSDDWVDSQDINSIHLSRLFK